MSIPLLEQNSLKFPPVQTALLEPNGLLAAGGDLSPERLVEAYRSGIFPWFEAGQPILWWSPDPRMVLVPDQLVISTTLKKLMRRQSYTLTFDQGFEAVIKKCAEVRRDEAGTWITESMQAGYCELFERNIAHSVEVWRDSVLVGGLYGIAIGRVFFGESMFNREDNTSKLALVNLVKHLQHWGYQLIDCQVSSNHLFSLGAREIPRSQFLKELQDNLDKPGNMGRWQLELDLGKQ
jgi:leucyl/phenylalanyl-tRNA--protein transferase